MHKRVKFSVISRIFARFICRSLHKLARFSVVVSGLQESAWLCVSVGSASSLLSSTEVSFCCSIRNLLLFGGILWSSLIFFGAQAYCSCDGN